MATIANQPALATEKVRDPSIGVRALALIIAALIIAIYAREIQRLVQTWFASEALSYGLLVPPLAAYLAWLRRKQIAAIPGRTDLRGLVVVTAACALFLAGKLGAEFFLSRTSLVLLLAGLVWTFWGRQRLRLLIFPLVVLESAMPLPMLLYNNLTLPLQLLGSELSTKLIQVLGYSVFQNGNVLHLPSITLGVAEACSGLNSLGSLMVGSLVIGFAVCRRVSGRVLLFSLAIPVAIGINIIRIVGTALLGDYNNDFAMGFYHSFSGWLVFVLGVGIMFVLAKLIHRIIDRKLA